MVPQTSAHFPFEYCKKSILIKQTIDQKMSMAIAHNACMYYVLVTWFVLMAPLIKNVK